MHLLCKLPDAWEKALQWSGRSEGMYQYCGFLTISHLVRRGIEPSLAQEASFFESVSSLLRQEKQGIAARCALNAATNYLDRSPDAAERLKEYVAGNKDTALTPLLEIFE
jgi:hypothetical protein